MRQDPVTGALQTDEQAVAADASVKEGFFARFEGRLNQIHARISDREKAAAEEKARVDALEQKQKQVEQGALDKVVAHFQSREQDLVLRHNELEAEHDLLQKNFDALLARLNGQVPGFYEALKAPPAAPVVVEKVPAPAPTPVKTPAQIEAERQQRQRAQQAQQAVRDREEGNP